MDDQEGFSWEFLIGLPPKEKAANKSILSWSKEPKEPRQY